jgi:predicted DsbA family dithiol-disulfide isomerase
VQPFQNTLSRKGEGFFGEAVMSGADKPVLLATVFSDYICPFCYIGDLRLDRLREHFDLKINWMLVEIHPDTPAAGVAVAELGYSAERWALMMDNLTRLAAEEGVTLRQPPLNANSHRALLLAEAAKQAGAGVFYRLHRRLFEAYFSDGRDIGDPAILRELATACTIPRELVDRAWTDPQFEATLRQNLAAAGKYAVRATPTIFFSEQHRLDGAVPYDKFVATARAGYALQQQQSQQQ